MRWILVTGLCVAGCGRAGFDDDTSGGGDPTPPALLTPACVRFEEPWTVSPPALVSSVASSADEAEPSLTSDGLTLYFDSDRTGNEESWHSTRGTTSESFGPPLLHAAVNSPEDDARWTLTEDGTEGFIATNRPGGAGGWDIWHATRSSIHDPFDPLTPVSEVNSDLHEHDPFVTPGGLRLYLIVWDGADVANIVVASRRTRGEVFSTVRPVTGINTAGVEANPTLTPDERIMFFNSDRAGRSAIFVAERDDPALGFRAPRPLDALDPSYGYAETYLWDCELYFASNRPEGVGGTDIYRVLIEPE